MKFLLPILLLSLANTATAAHKLITLGDSFISGVKDFDNYDEITECDANVEVNGETFKLGPSCGCARELDTSPTGRLAKDNGFESIFLACGGAEPVHMKAQFDFLNALYPEEAAAGWADSTMILSIGGNLPETAEGDNWFSILERCAGDLSQTGGCFDEPQNAVANWEDVELQLTEIYQEIADTAPNARIRIIGYPLIFQRKWNCKSAFPMINNDEADAADKILDENMNVIVAKSVTAVQLRNPGTDIGYIKSGIDGGAWPSRRQMHPIIFEGRIPLLSDVSAVSLHPTQRGYDKIHDAIESNLNP